MTENKEIIVYHYQRNGKIYTTPSLQIAVARKDEDGIKIETVCNGESEFSNLKLLSDD